MIANRIKHGIVGGLIGGSFGVLVGPAVTGRVTGLATGLVYGALWWFLGPLTLLPPGRELRPRRGFRSLAEKTV